jgi:DNA-binding NarL/FixJ family response regulator
MITVALADDQALVRDGFRLILDVEPDIEVVAEASDGVEAVELVALHHPDVLLMDIRMPSLDGITATRRIAASGVTTKVLILTTFDRERYLYDAMRAGASGFLVKDLRRAELVRAIRTASSGDALIAPTMVRRLVESFCAAPPPGAGVPPALSRLTQRELDVLRHVARGRTNAEIAAELHLGETTVKTHVAHISQKLNLRDRISAVLLAYETGLVRPGGQ